MRQWALAASALLIALPAYADSWDCQSGMYWEDQQKPLLQLLYNEVSGDAQIEVSGASQKAWYHVAGVNRRWDFGLRDNGNYDYAIVLHPDGAAFYFDFSYTELGKVISPSQRYTCRPRQ